MNDEAGEAERSEEGEAERSEAEEADNARIHERLDCIEQKLDKVLAMLSPVHSHAEWVDGLRTRLHGLGLVRNTPRVTSE